jgi:arylsulfatase A-like enzyme
MKVLVLTASGLHLGYVGCYGNEWISTPALDRLAAAGVVFDQHYAEHPDRDKALCVWQTGRYAFPLAPGTPAATGPEPPNHFSLFREHGIATILITDQPERWPVDARSVWEHVHAVGLPSRAGTTLERVIDAVIETIHPITAREHWLVWVDSGILLPPWSVPDEFRAAYTEEEEDEAEEVDESPAGEESRADSGPDIEKWLQLQNEYGAAVTYLDSAIGLLVDELDKLGLSEEVLLLFTTDHGQALGEPDARGADHLELHEERLHLPLIVRLPGKAQAGRRIPALTQPVDLLPTLFEAFGLAAPAVHGQSLWPLLRGKTEQVRAYACAGLGTGESGEWALRTPEWGFLFPLPTSAADPPPKHRLYVKPDDRWEVNDVNQHHLELAESLEQTLRGFVEATRRDGPLQPPELRKPEEEPAEEGASPTANNT